MKRYPCQMPSDPWTTDYDKGGNKYWLTAFRWGDFT